MRRSAYASAVLSLCVATTLCAQATGTCNVNKTTEILCMNRNQFRGILVDIRPRVAHVRAQIDTYYTTCHIVRPKADISDVFTFSQEPGDRKAWVRYNGGFGPVENIGGWRNPLPTCVQVFIIRCREVADDGTEKPTRPCAELLEANGFMFEERSHSGRRREERENRTEQRSAQELLPQLHHVLALSTQNDNGTTLSLTRGNTLPAQWIFVTDENPANGVAFQAKLRSLIEGAQSTVDIVFLAPLPKTEPDDHFTNDLREALTNLAATGRSVTVRMLFGFPVTTTFNTEELLKYLLASAKPGHRLKVSIATMTAYDPLRFASWPHSKMVVADGKRALVCGHNLYSKAYLVPTPVLDLSMALDGPAAMTAARFASVLWRYVCTYNRHAALWGTFVVTYDPFIGKVEKDLHACNCFDAPAPDAGSGGIPVLSVGHLGMGLGPKIEPAAAARWVGAGAPIRQWSDEAMTWLIGKAKSTIRISQQDLAFTKPGLLSWNDPLMRALGEAMDRNVDVYIILSNPGAWDYSSDVPYYNVALKLREFMTGDIPTRNQQLNLRLHIAPVAIRLNGQPSTRWGDVTSVANHAKFYMIDDKIFYVGSHNMYPPMQTATFVTGANQEFGFIVEDAASAQTLLDGYWNPRWALSKPFMLTGLSSLSKDRKASYWRATKPIVDDPGAEKVCGGNMAPLMCGGGFQWNGVWWTIGSGVTRQSYCQCIPDK